MLKKFVYKIDDEGLMVEAVILADRGRGHTRPNPPVGAIVYRDGKIVGRGYHKRAGGDHAEVKALRAAGSKAKGATLYVTLEPCSTVGRVGACTDAIIQAGIKRVVYGVEDPNSKNRGKAKRILEKAGIKVKCLNDYYSRNLILPFAKHVTTGLPYVTVKIAMSLDGKICDNTGNAKWISSEQARDYTLYMRHEVDAIMVGAETIRRDNPLLLPHDRPNKDLIRVVISRSGKLPKKSRVFTEGENETLVFPDAELALRKLGSMGVTHVLCEGGLKLATSLVQAGLVDDWITVLAPIIIGDKPLKEALRVPRIDVFEDNY